MPEAFDLGYIGSQLHQRHNKSKQDIKRLLSLSIIMQDLKMAKQSYDIWHAWFSEKIIPARIRDGSDENDEGRIGRALFVQTAALFARSSDRQSTRRRQHILDEAFFAQRGLADQYISVMDYRSNEFAHYGKFMHGDQPYSDDKLLMCVDGDITWVTHAWNRFNSSAMLSNALAVLIEASLDYVKSEYPKAKMVVLDALQNDAHLRSDVSSIINVSKNDLGRVGAAFNFAENLRDGPLITLKWPEGSLKSL